MLFAHPGIRKSTTKKRSPCCQEVSILTRPWLRAKRANLPKLSEWKGQYTLGLSCQSQGTSRLWVAVSSCILKSVVTVRA